MKNVSKGKTTPRITYPNKAIHYIRSLQTIHKTFVTRLYDSVDNSLMPPQQLQNFCTSSI